MMEKWILSIILLTTLQISINLEDGSCNCDKNVVGGEQVICQNVTPSFFENVDLNLTRAQWLKCENCILTAITETTFRFSKNNISYLNLNRTKITFIGNYAFNKLPHIKLLNLKENFITTIEYKAFHGIKKLLHLDLSQNKLKSIEDNVFVDLSNLDILNLNENLLLHVDNDAFAGLINLKYLYLNKNRLTKLQTGIFQHLGNLKILYLEENGIAELEASAFSNLRNLNHLYLNNNSITNLVQYNFKDLTSLLELQLRFNNLTEIETSSFNGLRNIKYLYLGNNHIQTIKPYGFVGLSSLLILDLIGNKFEHFSLEYLNDMEHLLSLWIQNNSISNFSITKQTETFKALSVLNVGNNKLDFMNFKFLYSKTPKLHQLIVGDNFWKCEIMVQMFEFFQEQNVSLCLNYECRNNETENYVQNICKNIKFDDGNNFDIDEDFVSGETKIKTNIYLVFILYILAVIKRRCSL